MSEEMKLLMALCDALGFKVCKHVDYKEQKEVITGDVALHFMRCIPLRRVKFTDGRYEIDGDGKYTTCLVEPETSYTVTKKESTGDEG